MSKERGQWKYHFNNNDHQNKRNTYFYCDRKSKTFLILEGIYKLGNTDSANS